MNVSCKHMYVVVSACNLLVHVYNYLCVVWGSYTTSKSSVVGAHQCDQQNTRLQNLHKVL